MIPFKSDSHVICDLMVKSGALSLAGGFRLTVFVAIIDVLQVNGVF